MLKDYEQIMRKLDENQKKALAFLKQLRSKYDLTYKETLEQIIVTLGYDYRIATEDIAKGLLIALVTRTFGYDHRRDTTLVALGLMEGYDKLPITERRIKYLDKEPAVFVSEESMKKNEDTYLAIVIHELAISLAEQGTECLDEIIDLAKRSFFLYFRYGGENSWHVFLARPSSAERTKQTHIFIEDISFEATDEKVADSLHKRINDGQRLIKTRNIMMTSESYIGLVYFYKYHRIYDAMVDINIYDYDGLEFILVVIRRVVDKKIVNITLPCEWEEAKVLVKSYKKPLLHYIYDSDEDTNDGHYLEELQEMGVVFY